jgi:LPS-assembly protein
MSQAEMNKIKVILNDETKIWAEQFRKKANDNKVMRNALYTPCDFCEGSEKPLWQIRARKVTHDAKRKDINYNDAFLDIKGVPVLYTPFLSHPDPMVRRRSGFLMPSIGSTNYLGGTLQLKYFWDINPNSDLLLSPIFTTDKNIVWGGQYRQYFDKGYLNVEGTYLKDNNDERLDHRGSVFAKTRYEINDYWVADADINYASDGLYLKELDLTGEDNAWLTSNVKLQRFESRDYALIEAFYYKLISYDLRENNASEYAKMKYNKPLVAPLAEYEMITDVSKIGSYWKNTFNFASVYHEGDNLSHRLTMINSWNLPIQTGLIHWRPVIMQRSAPIMAGRL